MHLCSAYLCHYYSCSVKSSSFNTDFTTFIHPVGECVLQAEGGGVSFKTNKKAGTCLHSARFPPLTLCFRIDFKVLLITYKALNRQVPLCLSDLLKSYVPSKS
ncbi:hypothetical protein ILYODFUR_027373 [Ilyodon furcidens]|uniref:Uncharacterized protein n=1 Tax=Ilyodon furcidens TaxID=33524 RepID=A0ABV0VHN1_9TELE